MRHNITQVAPLALGLLKDGQTGSVHSVYRKTVNLSIDSALLALQAKTSPLSPVSLRTELSTDSLADLSISEGSSVRIQGSQLLIGSLCFSFDDAALFPTLLSEKLESHRLSVLKKRLDTVLSSSRTGGFDLIFHAFQSPNPSFSSPILEGGYRYILQATKALEQKDPAKASSCLSRLVGLGIGLTPSGDDFLCGILAGLSLSGKGTSSFALLLRDQIKSCLSRTNDISRTFLRCALQNHFSPAVLSLAKSPLSLEIRDSFKEIGHSSGMDTLYGIFFLLDLIEKGLV